MPENRISRLIHTEIQALRAYRVEDSAGMIKLDAMESPYGIPEGLRPEWLERLRTIDVNRYPEPDASELKTQLREIFKIPADLEIMLGNGSDELIQLVQLAVAGAGRKIMSPQPSFSMYEIIARYTRGEFVSVSLDDNFGLSQEKWMDALQKHSPACVFFSHPNNPTGNLFNPSLIEETAACTNGLVVVDEAYQAYADHTMMPFISGFENMLAMRTMSKSGLAGLRLGYMAGITEWVTQLEKLRFPYNVNVLTQESVMFALENWSEFSSATELLCTERERMTQKLQDFDTLTVYPSQTNFLTIRLNQADADQVFQELKKMGILIKNLNGSHPVLTRCLRLTIGTLDENNAVCEALARIL